MIYEIFNAVDGSTQGYKFGEEAAKRFIDRVGGVWRDEKTGKALVFDFLPAREGFYVLDMRDVVKAGPFVTHAEATRKADFENMSSDTNSFRVFAQTL